MQVQYTIVHRKPSDGGAGRYQDLQTVFLPQTLPANQVYNKLLELSPRDRSFVGIEDIHTKQLLVDFRDIYDYAVEQGHAPIKREDN